MPNLREFGFKGWSLLYDENFIHPKFKSVCIETVMKRYYKASEYVHSIQSSISNELGKRHTFHMKRDSSYCWGASTSLPTCRCRQPINDKYFIYGVLSTKLIELLLIGCIESMIRVKRQLSLQFIGNYFIYKEYLNWHCLQLWFMTVVL